jgi:hypothetical protein
LVLRLCILAVAGLLPAAAAAQEGSRWHGKTDESGASLYYGIPQTDDGSLSFSCTRGGDGLTFTYTHEPIPAYEGLEVEVLLQAGDIVVPIKTFGTRLELDGAFFQEGRVSLDAQLIDLITSRGTLFVIVEDGAAEYPLDGAREAAAPLIETCRGQTVKADAIDIKPCKISAWSTDKDRAGLNIRAGPGTDTAIIGKIPPRIQVDGEAFAAEVTITGTKDGWFRIADAEFVKYGEFDEPMLLFEGEGWISGSKLGLALNYHTLYSLPSLEAPAVASLSTDTHGADSFVVDRLHACRRNWVEVEGTFLDKPYRGWVMGTCSNQITTCP